jgi:hypothetical protein
MNWADDALAEGLYSLGDERTVDLETLLAVSRVVGHLQTRVSRLPMEDVRLWDHVLTGGVFHDAELESLIDRETASDDELREDVLQRVLRLRERLRQINHQKDAPRD